MQNRKFEKGGNAPPRKKFQKIKRYSRQDFYVPGLPSAVKVPDSSPMALERALKYLKRQMKDADTIPRFRSLKEYTKPSLKRRKMKDDAIRKQQLREKISKRYWKEFTWVVPMDYKNSKHIGPNLPD